MKKNTTKDRKPLEINPTTVLQLDPEQIDSASGGYAREATRTSDSCDGCTQTACPDCRKAF